MERMLETLEVTIPQGRTLRLQAPAGTTIRVVNGTGWITEENDNGDYVLASGDGRRVAATGLILVHAFREARVEIESRGSTVAVLRASIGDRPAAPNARISS